MVPAIHRVTRMGMGNGCRPTHLTGTSVRPRQPLSSFQQLCEPQHCHLALGEADELDEFLRDNEEQIFVQPVNQGPTLLSCVLLCVSIHAHACTDAHGVCTGMGRPEYEKDVPLCPSLKSLGTGSRFYLPPTELGLHVCRLPCQLPIFMCMPVCMCVSTCAWGMSPSTYINMEHEVEDSRW